MLCMYSELPQSCVSSGLDNRHPAAVVYTEIGGYLYRNSAYNILGYLSVCVHYLPMISIDENNLLYNILYNISFFVFLLAFS